MTISPQDDIPDNIEELASEYVLGTLSAARRSEVQNVFVHDADLRAALWMHGNNVCLR